MFAEGLTEEERAVVQQGRKTNYARRERNTTPALLHTPLPPPRRNPPPTTPPTLLLPTKHPLQLGQIHLLLTRHGKLIGVEGLLPLQVGQRGRSDIERLSIARVEWRRHLRAGKHAVGLRLLLLLLRLLRWRCREYLGDLRRRRRLQRLPLKPRLGHADFCEDETDKLGLLGHRNDHHARVGLRKLDDAALLGDDVEAGSAGPPRATRRR